MSSSVSTGVRGDDARETGTAADLRRLAPAGVLALAGLWCFRFELEGLWQLWLTDPLRSIGMLIPPTSLVLALRAWTLGDWRNGGSWWGLALAAAAMAGTMLVSGLMPRLNILAGSHMMSVGLLPIGALLCAYVSGVVLLFGGTATWRKAAFPLLLLLFVNPVPGRFNALVDLPLQHFAALTARAFAALLHVPVSEGTLKMMFATDLGMFIAPGCDGVRGATTMGYLALVIGYLYRMPRGRWAAYVAGAVLLAYVFNLLRLCGVVGYYWVALRVPAIANDGTEVDYAIGGVLFTLAAFFLFGLPRYWKRA